jgi:hypothetical protein
LLTEATYGMDEFAAANFAHAECRRRQYPRCFI